MGVSASHSCHSSGISSNIMLKTYRRHDDLSTMGTVGRCFGVSLGRCFGLGIYRPTETPKRELLAVNGRTLEQP